MSLTQLLCLFILVASTVACSSPKIGYDYNPNTRFSTYHTYDWMSDKQEETGDKRVDNSLVDVRIRTAIETQLRLKGYTTSTNKQPDFYVAYLVAVKDMMKGSSRHEYMGDMAHGTYTTISDIQPYKAGALLVDIVDAASKELVWRGSASAEVDPGMTPEERNERISHVVHEILSHFPPQ